MTYSLISADDEEVTKDDVLFKKKVVRHNMKRIKSKLHRIGTYNVCKISLSALTIKDMY